MIKLSNTTISFAPSPLRRLISGCIGAVLLLLISGCTEEKKAGPIPANKKLHQFFVRYWNDRMRLYPLESTATGDNRYNASLPASWSSSYQDSLRSFYNSYLQEADTFHEALNWRDKESLDIFKYEMKDNLEGLTFPVELLPVNQFSSFTLEFAQLAGGSGNQPFKTVRDYDNFLRRMAAFTPWTDTVIANLKKGIQQGVVLPKALALKMIPQLESLVTLDPTQSVFYEAIRKFPSEFKEEEKKRLENGFFYQITHSIFPSYQKLSAFLQNEYIPQCRLSSGFSDLPNGKQWYEYLIRHHTTTSLIADSIYRLGLKEVARIKGEMEKVMKEVNFTGSLQDFFLHINQSPEFYPFTTQQQVLDSFWSVKNTSAPYLKNLFLTEPKTKFEIRRTEAFREASASAEYNPGSGDGSRPGIFYVPIPNPKKFNVVGMETLFLHEAIPGHHYQISLQQENRTLPQFRKFINYNAYTEGWALYTETLGKELGLYKNPYQYLGHLSDAMHRAIRLVVDVAIHTQGMTREEAIAYMCANERISTEEATSEIERYMAIPGQALSYKIGQLTISALKEKYQKKLGPKFRIKDFHYVLLQGGNLPLDILEKKLERWSNSL